MSSLGPRAEFEGEGEIRDSNKLYASPNLLESAIIANGG
jgi:hypothetical protein